MSLPHATPGPRDRSPAVRHRVVTLALLAGAVLAILATYAGPSAAWTRTELMPRLNASGHAARDTARTWLRSPVGWGWSRGAAGAGYVMLDGSPGGAPAANPQTHTVYVPIQCADMTSDSSCTQTASNVLDVINSASCNATVAFDCHVTASAVAGRMPISAIVDPRTDTVYVGDAGGSGAITVVNGATCNASVTTGCRRPVARIALDGGVPAGEALDPATGTLYVASPTGAVYAIAITNCNAATTSGCATPMKSIADSFGPIALDVDLATHTVYVADGADEFASNTVSVITGATCNATQSSGCGQTPPTVTVGTGPESAVVDQRTNTVYVANAVSGSVSVINGAKCNGGDNSGCGQTPASVFTGSFDTQLGLDASRHTIFSLNAFNDTMSAIDADGCNAKNLSGCPAEARNEQVPFNPPEGGPPNMFTLVPQIGTAYVVDAGGANVLQPVGISQCNPLDTSNCRREAAHVPGHEFFPVVDAAAHTLYAANTHLPQIDVFDAAACKAGDLSGCTPIAEIPMAGPQANLGPIDDATQTLYAGNIFKDTSFDPGNTISVINIAQCTAADTSGCHAAAPTVTVGTFPSAPVLDPATHTLYDVYGANGDHVTVVATAHCSAHDSSRCDQHPGSIAVPPGAGYTALSEATDTIYQPSLTSDTVSVIDGAKCNASDHSGCGQIAANVRVGADPLGVAVNDATHTLYVGNSAINQAPGTVSMIDTRTCNGSDTHGCTRNWPTLGVGRDPQQIALDPTRGQVYVADNASAAVSVVDGKTCNAGSADGCPATARAVPTAGSEQTLTVDPTTNTVYVATSIGSTCCGGFETLSIFRGVSSELRATR